LLYWNIYISLSTVFLYNCGTGLPSESPPITSHKSNQYYSWICFFAWQ
jgi:hypothetical protein